MGPAAVVAREARTLLGCALIVLRSRTPRVIMDMSGLMRNTVHHKLRRIFSKTPVLHSST